MKKMKINIKILIFKLENQKKNCSINVNKLINTL